MARWQIIGIVAFLAVYSLTVILAGEPLYIIPVVILAVLVIGYALANRALTKRMTRQYGSIEDALSDETEPIPAAHLIPDDETPAGDTPEAHDEINPHDLPVGHPGRREAERQAGSEGGTTRGDVDPSRSGRFGGGG